MERDGINFISVKFSREDYLNLNLQVNSNQNKWSKAIEILKDRFYGRYFDVIENLYVDWSEYKTSRRKRINYFKVEKNGFTIMAIICLLIDAFYQFKYGLESSSDLSPLTGRTGVTRNYIEFLKTEFVDVFGQNEEWLADKFYDHIRCGILHSAQTKGCSKLAFDRNDVVSAVYENNSTGIRVNIIEFYKKVKKHFGDYVDSLENGYDIQLRNNFIVKMNYVCGMI